MTESNKDSEKLNCGLIMPIAPMPGYDPLQFIDVKNFLINTITEIEEYDFKVRLVSESDGEIDVIHKSIVNNINKDPIVICDISGKNGNVMLELGLRLAFDKPVIIIKDDKTDYMFDISMIEHLEYPSDLRHNKMLDFKNKLKSKIVDTYNASLQDPDYSPFLKHFREIKIASIGEETLGITEALSNISHSIENISDRLLTIEKNAPFPHTHAVTSKVYNSDEVLYKLLKKNAENANSSSHDSSIQFLNDVYELKKNENK